MGDVEVDKSTEESITFVWENHHSILTQGLWALFTEKYQSDVKLECNGRSLWAHQLILSIFCPNLKTAFTNGSSRVKMDRLVQSGEDMELLVKVLYQGSVTVSQERLGSLQKAAGTLGIKDLLHAIESYKEQQESCVVMGHATYGTDHYQTQDTNVESGGESEEIMVDLSNKCEVEITEVDEPEQDGSDQWRDSPTVDFHPDVPDRPVLRSFESRHSRREPVFNAFWRNKPLLRCQFCSFKSYFMAGYKRHIMSHDKTPRDNKLLCRHCNAVFKDRLMYRTHLRSHMDKSATNGRFKCHLCSYSSGRRTTFTNHLALVHDLDSDGNPLPIGAFWCQDCGFICEDENILTDHMEQNHPEKTSGYRSKFQCPSCPYVSAYKIVMERHKRIHETPGKGFMCKICGLQIADSETYTEHMLRHENVANDCSPPEEPTEPVEPTAQTSVSQKVPESATQSDKCEICGYRNKRQSRLDRHRMTHTNVKAYPCPFCPSCFTYKYNMGIHVENVHKKSRTIAYAMMDSTAVERGLNAMRDAIAAEVQAISCVCLLRKTAPNQPLSECSNDDLFTYSCSSCSLSFDARTDAERHWKGMHDDKFPMLYLCAVCNYRSKNFTWMALHLRRHLTNGDSTDDTNGGDEGKVESSTTRQHPFICFRCDLKFDSKQELKLHKRSQHYTSATLFKCSKCSYTSLERSDVTRHLKESHVRNRKCK